MEEPSTPEQLYALPPEQFTAARDAAAKQAKRTGDADRAARLRALRRPSVSAWLVNRLAGERAELLEQLLALGPALAAAQASGSGDELRALGEQRRQLVEAVVDQAAADAGRAVTPAVRAEVASTLEAALADPASAEAVRSGLLVRALAFVGFGGVDLDGAVAAPVTDTPRRSEQPKRKGPDPDGARGKAAEVEAAEQAALEAGGALDDAVRRCEALEQARVQAQEAAAAAAEQVQRIEQELAAAREAQAQADTAATRAEKESATAITAVQQAQHAAETARQALDRLRRA